MRQVAAAGSLLHARLSLLLFMQFFTWGAWFVTLGNYLMRTLKLGGYEVGLAYGATAIASSFTPFLVGMIADRWVPAQRLLAFLHLAAAGLLWMASITNSFGAFYTFFLPYTFLYLPTFSLATAVAFRHIADPASEYPWIRVWGSVGWIIAGVGLSWLGWEASPWPLKISAALTALHGLYCLTLPHTPPLGTTAGRGQWLSGDFLALFKDQKFTTAVICLALSAIPGAFYYSFVNPYLNEKGVSMAAAKMSLGQVSEIIIMLILPWLTLRAGLRNLLWIGYLTWGLRYVLLSLEVEWMMYTAIILHGVAFIFTALATQIFIDGYTPPHLKSTVQGFIVFLTNGLGTLLGSWLAGITVAVNTQTDGIRNWPTIWWVPASAGIAIAGIFSLFFTNKK